MIFINYDKKFMEPFGTSNIGFENDTKRNLSKSIDNKK